MPDAIHIQLSPAAAALVSTATPARVVEAIRTAMQRQSLLTIGEASERRMNFPGDGPIRPDGLRHRTGQLLRSLRAVTTASGDTVTAQIGSNLKYFGVHEFGWSGTQNVKAHQRRGPARVRLAQGGLVNLGAAQRLGLLGKSGKLKPGVGVVVDRALISVRAHTRQANFPARMMIQRTIIERTTQIGQALSHAVESALTTA